VLNRLRRRIVLKYFSYKALPPPNVTEPIGFEINYQWWFSPGTPASSATKTGHHDIAEILLKVALNTKNQII
jgi:hypothetical protein